MEELDVLYLGLKSSDTLKNRLQYEDDEMIQVRKGLIEEIIIRCAKELDKNVDEVSEEFALEWIENKKITSLLNRLINSQIEKFFETDEFAFNNLTMLLDIIKTEFTILNSYIMNSDRKLVEIPKISEEEYQNFIVAIIKIIDPSLEWLKIYKKVVDDGKIIDLSEQDKIKEIFASTDYDFNSFGWEVVLYNNENYIITDRSYTLKDVVKFIHEFTHYVLVYKKGLKKNVLDEYLPILYEMVALNFLLETGYDRKIIEAINYERIKATFDDSIEAHQYFTYFINYLENSTIDMEKDIEEAKRINEEVLKNMPEEFKNDILKEIPDFFDPVKTVKNIYNQMIEFFLSNYNFDNKFYKYIIGYYFAKKSLCKDEEEMLLTALSWSEDFYTMDISIIFEYFGHNLENIQRS